MLLQQARIGTKHFAATNLESGIFKSLDDLTSPVTCDAIGFQ
jgi:hypothetical protein